MTPIIMTAARMVRKGARFVTLAAAITLLPDAGAFAAQPPDQMRIRKSISAPAGAADLCGRYSWACARSGRLNMSDANAMSVAKAVNSKINRAVRPVSDRTQYGTEEYWTLPSARGGDCLGPCCGRHVCLTSSRPSRSGPIPRPPVQSAGPRGLPRLSA